MTVTFFSLEMSNETTPYGAETPAWRERDGSDVLVVDRGSVLLP